MNSHCQNFRLPAGPRGAQPHHRCIHSSPGRRRQLLRVQAAKTESGPSVAIVGVTGAVGQEFLRVRLPLLQSIASPAEGFYLASREKLTRSQ